MYAVLELMQMISLKIVLFKLLVTLIGLETQQLENVYNPQVNLNQILDCPVNPYHYANLAAKKCTPKCPNPLWGDKSTKSCVSNCPWNPKTYVTWKNPDTQECVTTCP